MQHALAIESIKLVIAESQRLYELLEGAITKLDIRSWPENEPLKKEAVSIFQDFKMAPREVGKPAKRVWGVVGIDDKEWAVVANQVQAVNAAKFECEEAVTALKKEVGRFVFKKSLSRDKALQDALDRACLSNELSLTSLYRKVTLIDEPATAYRFHASYKNKKSIALPYLLIKANLEAMKDKESDTKRLAQLDKDLALLANLDKSKNYCLLEAVSPCPCVNLTFSGGKRKLGYAALPLLAKTSVLEKASIRFPEGVVAAATSVVNAERLDKAQRRHVGIMSMPIFSAA